MKPLNPLPTIACSLAVSLLICLLDDGAALGGEGALQIHSRRPELLGTQSCSSTSCHGQLEPQPEAASTHGQAYHLWLAHDPHARAGLRIMQPRFQEVLRRVSRRADGGIDPAVYRQCAQCHDLEAASTVRTTFERGIGCESCHGPASEWIAKHYELGVSHEELHQLGMVDTKDVLVRAKLCAECHVGSAEHDVTHDMLAAGHPPLRFEMTSHQTLIERKHWDDSPRRRAQPEYELQLWGAGRIAAAEAALALLEGRAKRAATDETQIDTDRGKGVWPELAEQNCFACHQPLRQEGRLALGDGARRAPGVAAWQHWNFACVPSGSAGLDAALDRLRAEMEGSFSPVPKNVARQAADARAALRFGDFDATANDLLQVVADRRGAFTWERACHELAALTALERSLWDRGRSGGLQPSQPVERRIRQSLSFTDNRFEWPGVFGVSQSVQLPPADTMTLAEVSAELNSWAERLRQMHPSAGH